MVKVELNVNCLHGNIWEIVELSENIIKSMWNDVKIIKKDIKTAENSNIWDISNDNQENDITQAKEEENSIKTTEKMTTKKNKAILSNDNVK